MARIKPHQSDLLRRIVAAQALSLAEVDGRIIRPLIAAELVSVENGRVTPTRAGRKAAAGSAQAAAPARPQGKLSHAQEDLLRLILRQPGIGSDEVDMRTLRALRSRELIQESGGRLTVTPAAAACLRAPERAPTKRKRGRPPRRHPRSEAILKAVEQLEHALPPEAEVLVGPIMCAAEDITMAFRKHARKLASTAG